MNINIVGWAAVSSRPQASEEKISLTRQLAMNLIEGRKWGRVVYQFVIPGESRDITELSEAAQRVTGWRLDSTGLDGLEGDALEAAIDAKLVELRATPRIYPYAELRAAILAKSFQAFSFYNLGRVGRDAVLQLTIVRLCQISGIFYYSTQAPPHAFDVKSQASYQANLMLAFQAVGYQNEIAQITENHRDGMIRRVERGRFPGVTPWGWHEVRNDKGKITGYTIDEDAAATIRLIVSMYLDDGLGKPTIADALNAAGHKTPSGGQGWTDAQIYHVLSRSRIYAGIAQLNRRSESRPYVEAQGIWPAIITEDRARLVLAELKGRRQARRAIGSPYRYSLLCYCGECGKRLHACTSYSDRTLASGEQKRYWVIQYRCREHHVRISERHITAALQDAIEGLSDSLDANAITGAADTAGIGPSVAEQIATVKAKIKRLEAGITKADVDHYAGGAIDSNRHSAIVDALKKQITDAQAELTRLRDIEHALEHDAKRGDRIQDVRKDGLAYLLSDDVRRANTWLKRRVKVFIDEERRIDVIFL
jgi:DNA invertase Pin-like site-specific DNA recombinase